VRDVLGEAGGVISLDWSLLSSISGECLADEAVLGAVDGAVLDWVDGVK
jgi:hypothetical protein